MQCADRRWTNDLPGSLARQGHGSSDLSTLDYGEVPPHGMLRYQQHRCTL